MAHDQQREFCSRVKILFPEYFNNVNVCDIGSLDINGNNNFLFSNYTYTGIDVGKGKNVNIVCKGHEYVPLNNEKYDIVISSECFEHDMFWDKTMINVCENLLKDKGMFLFTCATTGRPEHGTKRTSPSDSPFTTEFTEWSDYYMNLTEQDVKSKVDLDRYFSIYRFYIGYETKDLYFWGIKK
jgi:SAM-dependent methyltransferase